MTRSTAFKQTALTSADSYKLGHADQYPEGTQYVYSNFTPRSQTYFNVPTVYKLNAIVLAGIQEFLLEFNEIWNTTFFEQDRDTVVAEFQEFAAPFCGPNGFAVDRLIALHDLGYLPLRIKSLPEGSLVPIGVPALTVVNTHPDFGWLTNLPETWMSTELWKSSTSATTAFVYRKILGNFVKLTGGSAEFADWQVHDFSVRGMSGIRDAARSGIGHLLSSLGTDNLPAVKLANDAYRGKETFVGGSVPATEHSVMCAGGKESEIETFRRLIKTYPSGVLSIVSDTWNLWNVIAGPTSLAAQLKAEIEARVPDSLGLAKIVFRPDSGNPVHIVAGYRIYDESVQGVVDSHWDLEDYEVLKKLDGTYSRIVMSYDQDGDIEYADVDTKISEYEAIGAIECLAAIFGTTTNSTGYKTLNPRVGLIYGDSITPERAEEILLRLMARGYASDNIVFGVGSYTYQYVTRDTFGFAMKATSVVINGEQTAIYKDPITDGGTKKSARGLLRVDKNAKGEFILTDSVSPEQEAGGELVTVFENSKVIVNESLADIRARLATYR